jgi:hypothetical protein
VDIFLKNPEQVGQGIQIAGNSAFCLIFMQSLFSVERIKR